MTRPPTDVASQITPDAEPAEKIEWEELEGVAWVHRTRTFRAIGHRFVVRTNVEAIGRHFDLILDALVDDPSGDDGADDLVVYSVLDRGDVTRRRYVVYEDTARLTLTRHVDRAVWIVPWAVNRAVVRSSDRHLFLHASAAATAAGEAALFPAPMESGKTTLVAGLVRAGLRYVTDEAVAIRLDSLVIDPYHKPLSIDPGSWDVLRDLQPAPSEFAVGDREQWLVDVRTIRPDALSGPCTPRWIVTPRYEAGADTRLEPMSRARAAALLVENCSNVNLLRGTALTTAAAVAAQSDCYRLTIGDLDMACELVLGLLGEAGAVGAAH